MAALMQFAEKNSGLFTMQATIILLLGAGFLVKRRGLVNAQGQKALTDLVLNVILPCNILNSFSVQLGTEAFRNCLDIFLVSLGVQALCLAWGKLAYRRENEDRRVCLSYSTTCSNAGFLGNPIAEGTFGAAGLMYASVYLIPLRIMMWSEGLAIFSDEKQLTKTIRKVAAHPCVVACALGILLMAANVHLPQLILTPIQTVGRCNTALSMLVIGMILEEIDLKSMIHKTVIWFTVNRLVLIPLAVLAVCAFLPLDHTVRGVSVLLAAMPAGATTSMLAQKYGRDPAFATDLVVFSTLCSIPTTIIWSSVLA